MVITGNTGIRIIILSCTIYAREKGEKHVILITFKRSLYPSLALGTHSHTMVRYPYYLSFLVEYLHIVDFVQIQAICVNLCHSRSFHKVLNIKKKKIKVDLMSSTKSISLPVCELVTQIIFQSKHMFNYKLGI